MSNVRAYSVTYLYHKAISDQEKACLSLELLLDKPAGIGDHSTGDFHQNLDEALDLLVDARDRLDMLRERYSDILGD
jgi:hypothetical protein